MKTQKSLLYALLAVSLTCGIFIILTNTVPRAVKPDVKLIPKTQDLSHVTSQKSGAPTGVPVERKRLFSHMSVQERNLALAEIKKKDVSSLFQIWLESGRIDQDPLKQELIGSLLARALRKQEQNDSIYLQIKDFLADDTSSAKERTLLLEVLGQASTKESLDVLIYEAVSLKDGASMQVVYREIRSAGSNRWNAQFHEELSPALEQVWRASTDQKLVESAGFSIAEVGSPGGVRLLLASALAKGEADNLRASVAQRALSEVRNPDAVPALDAILENQTTVNQEVLLASGILAQMIDVTAARSLLNWLQHADESAAPLAHDYVVQTRTDEMLKTWETALIPTTLFRNENIRAAIRAGLVEFHENRTKK